MFLLKITPYSLNLYRNAHFRKLHRIKADIGEDIHWQLMAQKPKKMYGPVRTTYIFNWKINRTRDLDNYVATIKFVQDVLTPININPKSKNHKNYGIGIIPDDSLEHIKELVIRQGDKEENCVELIIEEV